MLFHMWFTYINDKPEINMSQSFDLLFSLILSNLVIV